MQACAVKPPSLTDRQPARGNRAGNREPRAGSPPTHRRPHIPATHRPSHRATRPARCDVGLRQAALTFETRSYVSFDGFMKQLEKLIREAVKAIDATGRK